MRCEVPAPRRPSTPSARSAAARGYPGCTRGQDAADAARHCNTQPVCWPPREPSRRPPGGHRSSWSRPPSSGASRGAGSFHPSGLSPSKRDRSRCLPRRPPKPGPAVGAALGSLPTTLGECRPPHSALFLGSSLLSRFKQMPRCPPPCRGSPFIPGQAQSILDRMPLAGPAASELPLGMEGSRAGARQASTLLWS